MSLFNELNIDEVKLSSGEGSVTNRFWLNRGETKTIIFLTNKPVQVREHTVKVDNKWQTFTCLKMLEMACPLCTYAKEVDSGYAYEAAVFTVLDTSEYKAQNGVVYKNQKKLFLAKSQTLEKIQRRANQAVQKGGSLRGAIVEVYRGNSKTAPTVGEEFELKDIITDIDGFLKKDNLDASALNYAELLKPDPEKVAEAVRKLRAETTVKTRPVEGTINY